MMPLWLQIAGAAVAFSLGPLKIYEFVALAWSLPTGWRMAFAYTTERR